MNCTGPMSNIVDFVPLLQWLPSPLKSKGKALHRDLVQTYGGMINEIKKKMQAGEKVDECLTKTMLDIQQTEELDHLDTSILASAFMIGGVVYRTDPITPRNTEARTRRARSGSRSLASTYSRERKEPSVLP